VKATSILATAMVLTCASCFAESNGTQAAVAEEVSATVGGPETTGAEAGADRREDCDLILKGGERLPVQVVEQRTQDIVVRLSEGYLRSIPYSVIEKIECGAYAETELPLPVQDVGRGTYEFQGRFYGVRGLGGVRVGSDSYLALSKDLLASAASDEILRRYVRRYRWKSAFGRLLYWPGFVLTIGSLAGLGGMQDSPHVEPATVWWVLGALGVGLVLLAGGDALAGTPEAAINYYNEVYVGR